MQPRKMVLPDPNWLREEPAMTAILCHVAGDTRFHAHDMSVSELSLCGRMPRTIFPNIEFAEVVATKIEGAVCPECREAQHAGLSSPQSSSDSSESSL